MLRAGPSQARQLSTRLHRALATHAVAPSPPPTRHTWKRGEIQGIFDTPLMELVFRAASVHRQYHDPSKIQLCTLMNIKTGGCSEDCSYCSQSSRYSTPTVASRLLDIEPANGSTRFCMGAAWRDLSGRKRGFERILTMVSEIRGMGMEVCTTLGMLSPEQARQLKQAGLTAYNHNLDTSREFYPEVITTRSYDERLDTISAVRDAGISVCSGGILGLGETDKDRVALIWEMSKMPEHPESFPVNALVPIEGTPLEKNEPVPYHTILRTISTARIVLPGTIIRLAAGRQTLDETQQAMCFMAGANAVFTGSRCSRRLGWGDAEDVRTETGSPWDEDKALMGRWGLEGMGSFEQVGVARKEGARLEIRGEEETASSEPSKEAQTSV
ncbi:biotin synthase [Epithele typhae]|uniref:biotin synthase n=1 Tax=Epithele typhae TaxID=378194 RepID=UPI0020082000|nr:biotin synthase [Epithele typhae]KAH9921987.1 biotin synthase [Epithele typhae]